MANSIAHDTSSGELFTESIVHSLLALALMLCDGPQVSVSSTALVTLRQMTAIVMDAASRSLTDTAKDENHSISQTSGAVNSVLLFIKDLSLSCRSEKNKWLNGMLLGPSSCLEILNDMLVGWKSLFMGFESFQESLKSDIVPTACFLLKTLHDDYVLAAKAVAPTPGLQAARTVRVVRCLLLEYLNGEQFASDTHVLLNLLTHTLRPEQGFETRLGFKVDAEGKLKPEESYPLGSVQGVQGIAAGLVVGAGGLASSMAEGLISRLSKAPERQPTPPSRVSNVGISFIGVTLITPKEAVVANVPAHPAGICLEALLSYFLQDNLIDLLSQSPTHISMFSSFIVNAIEATSFLVEHGMSHENSVRDFDRAMKSSQLVTHMEGLLSGAETDVKAVVLAIHDMIMASPSISPSEVLVLAFQLLQVLVRIILKYAVCLSSVDRQRLFFPPTTLASMVVSVPEQLRVPLQKVIFTACERGSDRVQDCCSGLLDKTEDASAVRRSLGILTELTLCCELLDLARNSSVIIAKLCKYTVPNWHGVDIISSSTLRWRHVQAFIRLTQVTHVLADLMVDWDTVVDSFDQLDNFLTSSKAQHDDVTPLDVDKIASAIKRFKNFTLYMSDESLVKLMTSLVALSMNSLAVSAGPSNIPRSSSEEALRGSNNFSSPLSGGESLGSTLFTIIDITKINSFRISIIWQMVTSHLKLIASLKSAKCRKFAVMATLDLIQVAIDIPKDPSISVGGVLSQDENEPLSNRSKILTDDTLFNWILPPFEECFCSKPHLNVLHADRVSAKITSTSSLLTQAELLVSLRHLAVVGYNDVHLLIVQGLLEMLQSGCEINISGWSVIIELLSSVADSMVSHSMMMDASDGTNVPMVDEEYVNDEKQCIQWPRASLPVAFSCMKLLVDDFLEALPTSVIQNVIICLSNFSAQVHDVNISLTAVEMLWKVVDFILSNSGTNTSSVLDVMMTRLLVLSVDSRPEIRNCSQNTLFSAIVSNSELLTAKQWRNFFEDILFPLFAKAEERSGIAMRSQEEAIAPELKRGVKMTIHHSRDTAHKQWSESRVLALKGLIRVVKICSKNLIHESWFLAVWKNSLQICVRAAQAVGVDKEVSIAGVDTLFAMIKSVSRTRDRTKSSDDSIVSEESEVIQETLWLAAWTSLNVAANYCIPNAEIPLRIATNLHELYMSHMHHEFKVDNTFNGMLDMIVSLSRPRILINDVNSIIHSDGKKQTLSMTEIHLNRTVMKILRQMRPVSIPTFSHYISCLCEISMSSKYAVSSIVNGSDSIILGAVDATLREEISGHLEYLICGMKDAFSAGKRSFQLHADETDEPLDLPEFQFSKKFSVICMRMLTEHFVQSVCNEPLRVRRRNLELSSPTHYNNSSSVQYEYTSLESESSILSWVFGSNSTVKEKIEDRSKETPCVPVAQPLPQDFFSRVELSENSWGLFSSSAVELKLMINILKECLTSSMEASSALWSSTLAMISCVMCPWKTEEIYSAKTSVEDLEEFYEVTREIFDLILDFAVINVGNQEQLLVTFIECLLTTCRVITFAIVESSSSGFSDFKQSPLFIHLRFLKRFHERVIELWSQCGLWSIRCRKILLLGLMSVANDLFDINLYLHCPIKEVEMACVEAMDNLMKLESTPEVLPNNFSKDFSYDSIITDWLKTLMAVGKEDIESWDNACQATGHQNSAKIGDEENTSTMRSDQSISRTGHILILIPSAMRLMGCSSKELRSKIVYFINSIDMASMVTNYFETKEKLRIASQLNEDLTTQLESFKAASNLPF